MSAPFLKNRKPPVYVFLTVYSLCCAFFLIESAFPGDLSSEQSGAVSDVIAFFANLFKDTTPAKKVEPIGLALATDSSFLNLADSSLEMPEIALGTTSQLAYTVSSPVLGKGEYVDPSFSASRNDFSTEEDYHLNVDSTSHAIYIVSTGGMGDSYSISVKAGSELTAIYSFRIVANPAPKAYSVKENRTSLELKQNESYPLSLTMEDPREGVESPKNDYYLRRIYDQSELTSSPNEESAGLKVDSNGVIHAYKEGNYVASYGNASVAVNVTDDVLSLPDSTSKLTISKENSDGKIALNDYDYYEANHTNGVTLRANWSGTLPGDTSVSWYSEDPLIGKIVSLEEPLSCHVNGYRKRGNVRVHCVSNVDPRIEATFSLTPEEIFPTAEEWRLQYRYSGAGSFVDLPSTMDVHKGEIITVKNTIEAGKNITNNALSAASEGSNATISGNGSQYITLSFDKVGASDVTFVSLGNPSLRSSLHLEIGAEQNVNAEDATFQGFVRKLVGHGTWFAITAVFGGLFFAFYFDDSRKAWLGLLLGNGIGLSIAGLSELIQHFVPGRYGAWQDIGIDMTGYVIGSMMVFLVLVIVAFFKKKRVLLPKEPGD